MNGFTHDLYGFVPFPKTWDDVPRHIVKKVFLLMDGPFSHFAKRVLSVLIRQSGFNKKLDNADYTNLLPLLNNLLQSGMTKNPLPLVQHNLDTLVGPDDKLANITLYEWILCSNLVREYQQGDEHAKDKLLAVLWRTQTHFFTRMLHPNAPKREALTDTWLSDGAKLIGKLPRHYRAAMFTFYVGSYEAICEANPTIFAKKDKVVGKAYDLTDLMADLAKEYYKSPSEIAQWTMDEVLFHLNKAAKHGRTD